MPIGARLVDAPHLQALHEPTPRLDLTPRHIVQQPRRRTAGGRFAVALRGGGGAIAIHAAFAAVFVYLLSFHDPALPRTVETPVEIVVEPKTPASAEPKPSGPKGDGAENADRLRQALAVPAGPAPDPNPPAPPRVQPASPPARRAPSTPEARPEAPTSTAKGPPGPETEAPKLVAPPPDPTKAAAQATRPDKAPNLAPPDARVDQAEHEAQPVEVPRVLASQDERASFAVPAPAPPPPRPVDKPAPPIPARKPTAAEKLAAALPMDLTSMPSSFRAVLSGNGAQVNAAYKGLVYGRFNQHPEIAERARTAHLKGQVIVAFTIDDAGNIGQIGVVQSSGDPAVDRLGVEMIRASAPFPPPPPDAQRSFTPALTFGP